MCGRYQITTAADAIGAQFLVGGPLPDFEPRYNAAPTQRLPVVRQHIDGSRRLDLLSWGLIPSSAEDRAIASSLINARAETVAEEPPFRAAFKLRRCVVPVDGWYEWKSRGKTKQPYRLHLADDRLTAFAGLWESWKDRETGETVESFCVITTSPNEEAAKIHDRMPVILPFARHDLWLDPKTKPAELKAVLRPYAGDLAIYPVERAALADIRANKPECIQRIDAA